MGISLIVASVIVGGLILAWAFHRKSAGRLNATLKRMAAEVGGEVRTQNLFVMPKLLFSYAGGEVEISSASTGIDGGSINYSYVLFKGLAPGRFEFRILPRSLQTVADEWAGITKSMVTDACRLGERLSISTNDDKMMAAILSEKIQADLLFWAEGERENRISDIRIYDDKLIYAVTGISNDYDELQKLIKSACRFFDGVTEHLSSSAGNS